MFLSTLTLFLSATAVAEEGKAVPLEDCPTDWLSKRKKMGPCDDYEISFRNRCKDTIEVKICLETPNRKDGWLCGVSPDISANGGWRWSVCGGTGERKVWVRRAGDYKHNFPKFP